MYSSKRVQPSVSLLTRDDLRPIAFVSSVFVFPSSNALSFLVSFYCYAMRTCATHDNRFNWCRQTLASIDCIINTNRVTPHFLYALFFFALITTLVLDVLANIVTFVILTWMPLISTIVFSYCIRNIFWYYFKTIYWFPISNQWNTVFLNSVCFYIVYIRLLTNTIYRWKLHNYFAKFTFPKNHITFALRHSWLMSINIHSRTNFSAFLDEYYEYLY